MDFGDLSDTRLISELTKKYGTSVPLSSTGDVWHTVEWDKVLEEFCEVTGYDKITSSEMIVEFMKESSDSA